MKQVAVTEEFKPEKGYTKEEIERTKFNSMRTAKGFGRYMLTSRTIEMNDFVALKKKALFDIGGLITWTIVIGLSSLLDGV